MKRTLGLWVCSMAMSVCIGSATAQAYEFPLQFTPNPGTRVLIVVGYQLQNNQVIGDCSSVTDSNGVVKTYRQTCRWDLSGNLLSITPGEPTPPRPLYLSGTRLVFAVSGNITTGFDFALGRGFVNTASGH